MINLRRRPFEDKTNIKIRKSPRVPCKRNAVIAKGKQMKNVKTKTEAKQLRNRKINNYKESSLSDSPHHSKTISSTKHIPIYLQNETSKVTAKKKDPFEFVDTASKKEIKEDGSDSDSSTYDKSIQETLRIIRNREKKEKNKVIKNIKKLETAQCKVNSEKRKPLNVPNHTPLPQLRTDSTATSSIICNISSNSELNHLAGNMTTIIKPSVILSTSTPVQTTNNHKNINIISNIQLQPSSRCSSPASMDGSYSFGYDYTSKNEETQPWRGDNLNLRRNPHWLVLKNSSLPYYNQEMILESELIEKFSPIKPINKVNNLVQTRIIDYSNSTSKGSVRISDESSLFDDHRFSPLKNPNKRRILSPLNTNTLNSNGKLGVNTCFGFTSDEEDKENTLPVKRNSHKLSANKLRSKKTLANTYFGFTSDEDDKENTVPIKRNSHKLSANKLSVKKKLVNTCFGFNSDEEDKENTPPIKRNSSKLPMRLSPQDLKKVRNEAVEKLVEVNKDLDVSIPIENNVPVLLFEDLEPQTPMQRTYTVKKRRKRIVSFKDDEAEEEEDTKRKKKRKNNRTRAEEEEFNKWAARFNQMCEEVEQHPLEIL